MAQLRKFLPRRKRIWALWLLAVIFAFLLVACGPVKMTLATANMKPKGMMATPALLQTNTTLEQWENEIAPRLRDEIQEYVYGYFPSQSATKILDKKEISLSAFNGSAVVTEYTLSSDATFGDTTVETNPFKMVVVSPIDMERRAPIILMQTFCPTQSTVPIEGISNSSDGSSCDGGGIMGGLMTYVFGRYIATPPFEDIVGRGYAVATVYASEIVPDRSEAGLRELRRLSRDHANEETRWGAIAAWAWGYSRMIDALVLDTDNQFSSYTTYGHSRFGKSALVAAVFDDRIDAIISHQSGTGGASLNKKKKGETVGQITSGYPHWFSKKYANYADKEMDLPFDQHGVIGLIAPRPVFLGNARRDVWSDPNGGFRSLQGASPVYKLYNKQGLIQDNLKSFNPNSDLSFYIRPGTHGVVKEDWPAFLDFMDAHFK